MEVEVEFSADFFEEAGQNVLGLLGEKRCLLAENEDGFGD